MIKGLNDTSFDEMENEFTRERNIRLTVARFDRIHPTVSGNKLFKLHYFIEECLASEHRTMLTFGGAYSNHLAATAFLCREKGIRSVGIVRGEEPAVLSHTLLQCREYGMLLHFVSRSAYAEMSNGTTDKLKEMFGSFTLVPEGGYDPKGAAGASLMYDIVNERSPSHICTAVGTATTLAGLVMKKKERREIIAIPVLKNMTDIPSRLKYLAGSKTEPVILDGYSFGGYAKYNTELTGFMNDIYDRHRIPTDFVYTAKMLFAVTDQLKKGYFKEGSHIICLHTGGLQGNLSLPAGTLHF